MPDQFLHGIEVIEIDDGPRPIKTVKSSVIGLVGTAPKGPVNTPVLITGSQTEAVNIFGSPMTGFTIPTALDLIFQQTGAMVVVINVADSSNPKHSASGSLDSTRFDDFGEIVLNHRVVSNVVVKKTDESKVFVENTDYNVDYLNGIINKTKDSSIPENENVAVNYQYLDTSKITMSEIVGGNNGDGTYKGVHCLLAAQTEVKVQPRILIAPGFTHQQDVVDEVKMANPVVSELLGIAERLRAIIIADCPNTNEKEAVDYAINYGSSRLLLTYPQPKFLDKASNSYISFPMSAVAAGLQAKSDNERGFWYSMSNTLINGIQGLSKPIDFVLGDVNCLANYLNENKITTIIQEDGFRFWGNRSTSADAKWAFLSVRRTADMINDSLQKAHLWAIDRNITKTYVEDVCEGVNNYLRYLKSIGAILGGKCWADSTINTPDQIEQGKVVFDFDFTPPYPAEHITFRSRMVNGYLEEVFK